MAALIRRTDAVGHPPYEKRGEAADRGRELGNPVPEGFDAAAQKGMGLRLVVGMVAQSGGTFTIRPEEGGSMAKVVVDEAVLEAYG